MPFSSDGTYTLASAAFVTQTGIKASPVNMDFNDIATALGTSYTNTLANQYSPTTNIPTRFAGNCRLTLASSSVLKLIPYNGNGLMINNQIRTIPSTGVSLTLSGLGTGLLYYVYAYWTGSAIALVLSTTPGAARSDNGWWVQFGDNTRTLVGLIQTNSATTTVDTAAARLVASWFNPPARSLTSATFTNQTVSSVDPTLLNFGVAFVRFANRPGQLVLQGTVSNSTANVNSFTAIGHNSSAVYNYTSQIANNVAGAIGPFTVSDTPFPVSDIDINETVFPLGWNSFGVSSFTGTLKGWII